MKQETKSFISFGIAEKGLIFNDENHKKYPIKYYNIIDGEGVESKLSSTYFVFIYEGESVLILENGMQSVLPPPISIIKAGELGSQAVYPLASNVARKPPLGNDDASGSC